MESIAAGELNAATLPKYPSRILIPSSEPVITRPMAYGIQLSDAAFGAGLGYAGLWKLGGENASLGIPETLRPISEWPEEDVVLTVPAEGMVLTQACHDLARMAESEPSCRQLLCYEYSSETSSSKNEQNCSEWKQPRADCPQVS